MVIVKRAFFGSFDIIKGENMSEKEGESVELTQETKDEIERTTLKGLYQDFRDICNVLTDVLDAVAKAGDLETLHEVEEVLDKRGQHARNRQIRSKLIEIYEGMDSMEVVHRALPLNVEEERKLKETLKGTDLEDLFEEKFEEKIEKKVVEKNE